MKVTRTELAKIRFAAKTNSKTVSDELRDESGMEPLETAISKR
jgi:hypothetical protein